MGIVQIEVDYRLSPWRSPLGIFAVNLKFIAINVSSVNCYVIIVVLFVAAVETTQPKIATN